MRVQTRHGPAFTVARLLMAGGEPVRVEASAMLATSYGVTAEARTQGGLLKSLTKAAFGGESLAMWTYTAQQHGGWVDVAPNLPGDVHVLELDGSVGWCITRGCWLASAAGVNLQTQWGGFRSLFGAECGFLLHASGHGPVVTSCYGALDVIALPPGELVTIGTGHVVAYADTVQSRIRQVSQGGQQSMRSGEGLVFDFAGPGQVLAQTRNPRGLIGWLHANRVGSRP